VVASAGTGREEASMEWDLGLRGVGLLLAMAFAAAVVAQVFTWRWVTHRLWIAATAAYAAIGLFVSEVMFGWATEEDLQPNVDGLSSDEVLLAMMLSVAGTVLLARWTVKHRRTAPPGQPRAT
jgi:hypothetical protein